MRGKITKRLGVATITSLLDEKTYDAISIAAGTAIIDHATVRNVETGEQYRSDNEELPVELPLGTKVQVLAAAYNPEDYAQQLCVTSELIDPDGIVRASERGCSSFGPVVTYGVWAPTAGSVTLDKEGVWQIHGLVED